MPLSLAIRKIIVNYYKVSLLRKGGKVICVPVALPASTLANTSAEGKQRFHLRTESLWIPVTKPGRTPPIMPTWAQCRGVVSSHTRRRRTECDSQPVVHNRHPLCWRCHKSNRRQTGFFSHCDIFVNYNQSLQLFHTTIISDIIPDVLCLSVFVLSQNWDPWLIMCNW